jgi:SAM-dependent methyltransferase
MKILDATAGCRSIWYQKNHPFVTFMDKRNGTFIARSENSKLKDNHYKKINPDVISEWKDAPFPDNYFDMVIFDPPHKIGNKEKKTCSLEVSYGMLYTDTRKQELKTGIKKLFDILKPEGIFILKWCETDKPLMDVLKLFPYKPLFGTRTGQKNMNHWIVFLKYNVNHTLEG